MTIQNGWNIMGLRDKNAGDPYHYGTDRLNPYPKPPYLLMVRTSCNIWSAVETMRVAAE
jgi:hypothetical protein